jgi:hypothetical protein
MLRGGVSAGAFVMYRRLRNVICFELPGNKVSYETLNMPGLTFTVGVINIPYGFFIN